MGSLRIPYPRPKSLSDPHGDFSPSTLESLLEIPDSEMGFVQLRQLLGPFLPAGTYEESSYFLPLAFDYLRSGQDGVLDLTTAVVGFVSEHGPRLARDGLLDAIRGEVNGLLDHWSSTFQIVHFDRAGCKAKGWGVKYKDLVRNSEETVSVIRELLEFKYHSVVADRFVMRLASEQASPIESAWLLEIARTSIDGVSSDARQLSGGRIGSILRDLVIIERSAVRVATCLPDYVDHPSYWRDTLTTLDVTSVPLPIWQGDAEDRAEGKR